MRRRSHEPALGRDCHPDRTLRPRRGARRSGRLASGPAQENVWQLMRDNWLSNRVFKSFDDIVDHCSDAWNKLND
jgi:hypothetical protein